MRRSACASLAVSLAFALSCACSDKKEPAEEGEEDETEEVECEENSDCELGWVCLAGECAKAGGGAIYTDTENAVTPDKVRKHLDQVNEKAQKRTDDMLKDL